MNKLTNAVAKITQTVFSKFIDRGGILRDGEHILTAEQMASTTGGLPPLLWMTKSFIVDDYKLSFAKTLAFTADPEAYTGYSLELIEAEGSASPTLLGLSSFLRYEVVPDHLMEIDFSSLFRHFKEWCQENVSDFDAQEPDDGEFTPPELG